MQQIWETKNVSLKSFGNRPIENISLDEVIPILQGKTENVIREINENMYIHKAKSNKFSDYIYYKTKKMMKPKLLSLKECNLEYQTCDIERLKDWIKNIHGQEW